MRETLKHFFKVIFVLFSISLTGMLGLHWIEGWSLFDSLYMSVITLTTVGFGELHPLSQEGRAFIIVYLVLSLGISLYSLAHLGEMMIKVQLFNWLGERKMVHGPKHMKNHYVIFGYGRMGKLLCEQLRGNGHDVLVIDRLAEHVKESRGHGFVTIQGDPTEVDLFGSLHLEKAKGIAAVFGSDADNLYVVLACRMACPSLHIVARASTPKCQQMLNNVGANRVVCPYSAGADVMTGHLVTT